MYGDTAASRKRVAQLREQSGDIRAAADRLVAQAESVPWHGRAAEAMRTRIKERANHLRVAAGHHETAADSLARHLTDDSMAFSHRLLAETGVALTPGIDFDTEAGGRHVRLSFAGPQESITVGLQRLGDWLPGRTT